MRQEAVWIRRFSKRDGTYVCVAVCSRSRQTQLSRRSISKVSFSAIRLREAAVRAAQIPVAMLSRRNRATDAWTTFKIYARRSAMLAKPRTGVRRRSDDRVTFMPSAGRSAVGAHLALRIACGYSVNDLASAAGVYAGSIRRLEAGRPVDKQIFATLAAAFGVPLCRLMCGEHSCAQ